MRADVKLGVVISVVLVSIAGGYYAFRGDREKPIQVNSVVQDSAKRPTKAIPHPAVNNRSAQRNTTPNGQVSRGAKTARNAGRRKAATSGKSQPLATRHSRTADTRVVSGATKPSASGRTSTTPGGVNQRLVNPGAVRKPKFTVPAARSRESLADGSRPASGAALKGATPPLSRRRRSTSLAAPIAQPTTKPANSSAGFSDSAVDRHRVQAGDTMIALAERYYGSPGLAAFLTASNPQLTNPSRLRPGQIVQIPPRPAHAAAKPKSSSPPVARVAPTKKVGKSYRVRPGDSFYKIAGAELGSSARWKELYELNKPQVGDDPGRLKVGQLLVLPVR